MQRRCTPALRSVTRVSCKFLRLSVSPTNSLARRDGRGSTVEPQPWSSSEKLDGNLPVAVVKHAHSRWRKQPFRRQIFSILPETSMCQNFNVHAITRLQRSGIALEVVQLYHLARLLLRKPNAMPINTTSSSPPPRNVRVAVWGCGHGELDSVYDVVRKINSDAPDGRAIELLICCGDFQAVRNEDDLECMACPVKYRSMGSFYRYYTGAAVAPVTTIFVGGNHEAANHLQELFYGGWVAPNIFFLGSSGVFTFRGLRIAGAMRFGSATARNNVAVVHSVSNVTMHALAPSPPAGISGIYKGYNFHEGYYERTPYSEDTLRSVFHVREFDYVKLSLVRMLIRSRFVAICVYAIDFSTHTRFWTHTYNRITISRPAKTNSLPSTVRLCRSSLLSTS